MSKPFMPFGTYPGHWGLKGKTRERAKAEYELDGLDLAYELAAIDFTGDELNLRVLEIRMEYKVITRSEFERTFATDHLEKDSKEQILELLRLDHRDGDLTDTEYDKGVATANNESWVSVVNLEYESKNPDHGSLELDWNDLFVAELREGGYDAALDEQVVEMWLADWCRNIAMEQFTGIGDFDENVNDPFIQKSEKTDDGTWAAK